jgi:hypothetical protein
MGCRAGFNPDQAGRQLRKEGQHLLSMQLLHKNGLPVLIYTMGLEDALRQVETYRLDVHRVRSSLLHSFSAPFLALRWQRRPHHQTGIC